MEVKVLGLPSEVGGRADPELLAETTGQSPL